MSSKIQVAAVLDTGLPKQRKAVLRDPRFDSLCGEFKEGVVFFYATHYGRILTTPLCQTRFLRKRTTL